MNSDRLYKLANNCQLKAAQQSMLGLNMGSMVISSVGLADDKHKLKLNFKEQAPVVNLLAFL